MDSDLHKAIKYFIESFEEVFDKDWSYTKEMLGVMEETEEQKNNAKEIGLETIPIIEDNATFISPMVDDETEDWGNRGRLLTAYRQLKNILEKYDKAVE